MNGPQSYTGSGATPKTISDSFASLSDFERYCVPRIFGTTEMPALFLHRGFACKNVAISFSQYTHGALSEASDYIHAQATWEQGTHEDKLLAQRYTKSRGEFSQALILITMMDTTPEAQGSGLGRRFLNICLAAMARNPRGRQSLVIDACHWPMFKLTDRFYHMRSDSNAPTFPGEPRQLFPDLYGVARPETKLRRHQKTYGTNIVWSTPLEWFFWRAIDVGQRRGDVVAGAWRTNGTRDGFPFSVYGPLAIRLVELLARGPTAATEPGLDAGLLLVKNIAVRDPTLGLDPTLAGWIGRHCRLLGYSDPARDLDHDVVAILVDAPPANADPADARVRFWLLHTLLTDYGRTLYRPIVYTRAAMAWFHRILGDDLKNDALWAVPRPAIARLGQFHIWVPQKKPSSVHPDTGDLLPLTELRAPERPLVHPALVYEDDDAVDDGEEEKRPTKRARLDACFSCLRPGAAFADGLVVHCDAVCRDAYYGDH